VVVVGGEADHRRGAAEGLWAHQQPTTTSATASPRCTCSAASTTTTASSCWQPTTGRLRHAATIAWPHGQVTGIYPRIW